MMNLKILASLLMLYAYVNCSSAQILFPQSFTEYTSDQKKMEIYLDSIEKYVYRDIEFAGIIIEECEDLLASNDSFSDSIKFEFVIQKIYWAYGKFDPVEAFKLISESEEQFDLNELSEDQMGTLRHLKSFTFMSLGDLEAAQKSYYEEIELGIEKNDEYRIFSNLYALGVLLNIEGEYSDAVDQFNKALSFRYHFN